MMVNTDTLVSMTEANQNFSKVVHVVEEKGIESTHREEPKLSRKEPKMLPFFQ